MCARACKSGVDDQGSCLSGFVLWLYRVPITGTFKHQKVELRKEVSALLRCRTTTCVRGSSSRPSTSRFGQVISILAILGLLSLVYGVWSNANPAAVLAVSCRVPTPPS